MQYQDKVNYAHAIIEQTLKRAQNPAIMCSFGKDSMVVLDLVIRHIRDIPVIFHRESFQPHRYRFANSVIDSFNLTVYDYPPLNTEIQEHNGEVEIVNYYSIGKQTCLVPTGIRAPQAGEQFVCGLKDIYLKPTGSFKYPWDFVFHGHKSTDVDPIYGKVPLSSDFAVNLESASASFPIRMFTDDDLWRYTEENNVPIHHTRYVKENGKWKEREDKSMNPDYFSACTACMNKSSPNFVPCPKMGGALVSNVSEQLRWAARIDPVYMRQ